MRNPIGSWRRSTSWDRASARDYDALWLMRHSVNHYGKGTALAFHIRRSWDSAELGSSEEAVETLAEEVRRLLPIVVGINRLTAA